MYQILLIEDEKRVRDYITVYFNEKGVAIVEAIDGYDALAKLKKSYDLVLLDIMMPHLDGFEICKHIRKHDQTPIIFISALSEDEQQLQAYSLGADDYITKPFKPSLLYAKCMALIKRDKRVQDVMINHITLYPDTHEIEIQGRRSTISNKEFQLLRYFVEHQEQTLSREQILQHIWGYDYYGDGRVVDTYIKMLRKQIQPYSHYIKTIVKVGYRFSAKE